MGCSRRFQRPLYRLMDQGVRAAAGLACLLLLWGRRALVPCDLKIRTKAAFAFVARRVANSANFHTSQGSDPENIANAVGCKFAHEP